MADITQLSNEELLAMIPDEELVSMAGGTKEKMEAPLAGAPGLERVIKKQEQRPNLYAPVSDAISTVMKGEAITPANVFTPSISLERQGIEAQLKEGAMSRLGEQLMTGVELSAIPFKMRENLIVKPLFKLSTGQGFNAGDALSLLTGNNPAEFGDFADIAFKEKTPISEAIKGTFGLAALGVANLDTIKKSVTKMKPYVKDFLSKGDKKVLAQHKVITEGMNSMQTGLYDRMNSFIDEVNESVDPNKFRSAIKVVNSKVKGALNRAGGAVKNIKDVWKNKIALGKEMKTVWSKLSKGESLTSNEQLLYNTYKAFDDVIEKSLTGDALGRYRVLKADVHNGLEAIYLAKGAINTAGGKAPDIKTLKYLFEEGSENALNILNGIAKANGVVSRAMQTLDKMSKTRHLSTRVKQLISQSIGGAITFGAVRAATGPLRGGGDNG